ASHPMELSGDWVVSPPVFATGLSLMAKGCLIGATPRAQRAERAADGGVVDVLRALLGRHVHRELLHSAWLDVTPIIPATACQQGNYVERYSRFIGECMKSPCLYQGRPQEISRSGQC